LRAAVDIAALAIAGEPEIDGGLRAGTLRLSHAQPPAERAEYRTKI